MKTSVARAEARIRQLCCLGLGGQAVMPALLAELHHLIPSHSNAFLWADHDLECSDLYDENPNFPEVLPLYLHEFYNRREREVFNSFTRSMRHEQGVQCLESALKVNLATFYGHDYYKQIYRPLGYRNFLRVVLREGDHALGRLQLFRSDSTEFSPRDQRRLASIAPYVAHALAKPEISDAPLVEHPDNGVIIAEPSGKIRHLSLEARRLLWLMTKTQRPSEQLIGSRRELVLPEGVRSLCHRLQQIFSNDEQAAPPVWQYRNARGGFTFRAYWLDGSAPESASVIGITVGRLEPLPLKVMRTIESLSLSERQIHICLLLAGGYSLDGIAARLDVTKHTADAYCRELYAWFEVPDRAELLSKLSSISA